jgi:hypothetical protein
MQKSLELRIGNVAVSHPLSPVPSNNTKDGGAEWMCYFNTNDTKFAAMLEETAKLVAARYEGKKVVIVCPESAPIALVHVLRTKYGF